MTFRELHDAVAALSAWLGDQGVRAGTESRDISQSCPRRLSPSWRRPVLGAVWSSSSPDFGTGGVLDRFGPDSTAKVLITADGYSYGGRHFEQQAQVAEILDAHAGQSGTSSYVPWVDPACDTGGLRDAVTWQEVMATSTTTSTSSRCRSITHSPSSIPLVPRVRPSASSHGHGGTLLQHLRNIGCICDLRVGDRLFYFLDLRLE